mgnify:CR=1 FL=1
MFKVALKSLLGRKLMIGVEAGIDASLILLTSACHRRVWRRSLRMRVRLPVRL